MLDLASVFDLPDYYPGESLSLFLGNGHGVFTQTEPIPSFHLAKPLSMTTGDFDDDGKLDLAIAISGSNTLTILHGYGDGTFSRIARK